MSWVADVKATSQKNASVSRKKNSAGMKKAMPAKAMAKACMVTIHHRLVRTRSTIGLQKGLMTHGR